ncbi:unnamed protein product [Brugia timori]|uniref:Uncharacterized protein n=1 Tax=Brugia timori TaxID=42155 RepID=A0A0R3QWB5_9BILA|nr:unnamed protein product [Brugia timori]
MKEKRGRRGRSGEGRKRKGQQRLEDHFDGKGKACVKSWWK